MKTPRKWVSRPGSDPTGEAATEAGRATAGKGNQPDWRDEYYRAKGLDYMAVKGKARLPSGGTRSEKARLTKMVRYYKRTGG